MKEKALVFASAVTQWHIFGVAAAIDKLSEGYETEGYCYLTANHATGKSYVDEKTVSELIGNDKIVPVAAASAEDMLAHIEGTKRAGFKLCYIVTPLKVSFTIMNRVKELYPECKVVYVIVDEGMGTYIRGIKEWYNLQLGKKSAVRKIKYYKAYIANGIKQKKLIKNSLAIDWNVLKRDGSGNLLPNREIVGYYNKAMGKMASGIEEDFEHYADAVIINTQPMDSGDRSHEETYKAVEKVCGFLKEKGVKVIIKPHPREKYTEWYESMGVFVEKNSKYSQELILASMKGKPRAIIAFTSTTLITGSVFRGIQPISLNGMVDIKKLDKTMQLDMISFNRVFSHIVPVVKSLDELEGLIMKKEF